MSEAEKQEGQKTVVAFITGLLIGGLLVWVFSASPEHVPADSSKDTDEKTEQVDNNTEKSTETISEQKNTNETIVTGKGSLNVSEQVAGKTVALGETSYPATAGWIVVRDLMDGMPGNILGAARYNTTDKLLPTQVELQRETVSGSSYQVVFYSDNGDKNFKIQDDIMVEGTASTFKVK